MDIICLTSGVTASVIYDTEEARRIHLLEMLHVVGYDNVADMLFELAVSEKCNKCGKRYWDHYNVC